MAKITVTIELDTENTTDMAGVGLIDKVLGKGLKAARMSEACAKQPIDLSGSIPVSGNKAEAERLAAEAKAREEAAKKKAEAERLAAEAKAREEAAKKKAEAERLAAEAKAKAEAAKTAAEEAAKAAAEEPGEETLEEETMEDTPDAAPAQPEETRAKAYTIEEVRALLGEKVADHRVEIKNKLTSLGAPNVTNLDPAKYTEFAEYLKALN